MNSIDIVKMSVPLIMVIINKYIEIVMINIKFNDVETIIRIVSNKNRFPNY